MSRWERAAFNALSAVVAVTGVVYFWMKYLLRSEDPFAVVNHPWQPAALALHVAVAPLLMMAFGIVFRSHVLSKLVSNGRRARRTGWTSFLSFAAMAVSGYLLQVMSDPSWLRALTVAHVASSVLFGVGYGAHLVIGWRLGAPGIPAPAPAAAAPAASGSVNPS